MTQLYDEIGKGYAQLRQPEPRIARAIGDALGDARDVVNVGAGTGSYEPTHCRVVAVEPSSEMIRQRRPGAGRIVRASGDRLPFRAGSFDSALAVLTIHHWPDQSKGLAELARVARSRVVLLTWTFEGEEFWLYDYFPEIAEIDALIFPSSAELARRLDPATVECRPVPIPHDCVDGFLGAYWRRPHAYLEPDVRLAISTFSKIRRSDEGAARLRADLDSGRWRERYGSILERSELDLGYRLLVADMS